MEARETFQEVLESKFKLLEVNMTTQFEEVYVEKDKLKSKIRKVEKRLGTIAGDWATL